MLIYSDDNFEILQTNPEVLQKTMEEQDQTCDHRRSDVFMYALCAQSSINNVSWTLNVMHSELQVQTLSLMEQRNIFITCIAVLYKGILTAALVPYEDLRKIITTLKLGDKKVFNSIRPLKFTLQPAHSDNCFFQSTGTVNWTVTMEVPVYSGEPIHDAYKAIPLPQPIKNTTTAATLKLGKNYLIISRREKSYAEMKSERARSTLLDFTPIQSRDSCSEDLHTRCIRISIFTTAIYLGNSMYLLNAADDQQFLYNITYSGGRTFSNRVPACNSSLVHPPGMENWLTRRVDWCCCPIQHIVFNTLDL